MKIDPLAVDLARQTLEAAKAQQQEAAAAMAKLAPEVERAIAELRERIAPRQPDPGEISRLMQDMAVRDRLALEKLRRS